MTFASIDFWDGVLAGAVRLATPLLLASLGETVVERSGSINLGLDGMMLAGAFTGAYGAYLLGPVAGVSFGIVGGAVLGLLMAIAVFRARADMFVAGITISLLGVGLTSFLYKTWVPSGRTSVAVPLVTTIRVPGLADIPLVGEALFHQSLLTYLAFALVPVTAWMLRSTRFGLRVRAVGDDADAATLRGLDPREVRTAALVIGGAMAGLAGATITVGYVGSFTDNITAGRGYLAIAIVIIGRRTAWGALAGAFLVATFESLSLLSQTGGLSLPVEVYGALPFAVTLLVLVLTARRLSLRGASAT
jgi:general nucleoside transport system permease protein